MSKSSMALKHGVPSTTFRDLFKKPKCVRTGLPKTGHKHSHRRLMTDEEEWVCFI